MIKRLDIKKLAHEVLENEQLFNELLSGVKSKTTPSDQTVSKLFY